ncbi:MAG: GGDEF domain-containing protein [Humidesulfovibrio sp.]
MLNIEQLPFLKFNSQTIRMAEVFSGWCADALENALLYTDTKSKTITDDITGAFTLSYMNARLAEECARARRYKTDLAMIVLDILGYVEYSESEQREVLTSLRKALKLLFRNIDLLFSGDVPGRYIILMPNTPLVGAKVVGGKIVQLVGDMGSVVASVSGPLPVRMGGLGLWRVREQPGTHPGGGACGPEREPGLTAAKTGFFREESRQRRQA